MHKILIVWVLGASALMAGQDPSVPQPAGKTVEPQFKVLNPWAEADPVTPRKISQRIKILAGKKIGLFANFKRASLPIVTEVGKQLKARHPDCETSIYHSQGANVVEIETINKEQFTAWLKDVDAVILAVGD